MTKKLKLPAMQVPCAACQEKFRENEKLIMVACPHNKVIAIMPIKDGAPSGSWQIFTPITPGELIRVLRERGGSDEHKGSD